MGGQLLAFNGETPEPCIMGVVNLSPGSWYRESVCLSTESAVERARVLHAQGAAIIDVGAESTLAPTERVDALHQNSRLLPVIKALRQERIPVPGGRRATKGST